MPSIGPLEIAILLAVVFFVFGAKRLPELAGSAGETIRGFGRGLRGDGEAAKPPAERKPPAEPERLEP